jgi:polyisoprenoid-binding protein YceI
VSRSVKCRLLVFAPVLLVSSCGGSKVQRAATVPVTEAPHVSPAPPPDSFGVLAKRYVVHHERSRLEVLASDSILGDHVITFDRWRAHVDTSPSLSIALVVDVTSLRMEPPKLGAWLQEHVLETRRYPQMKLDATMRIVDAREGTASVEAIAEVHGVRRALRFNGVVTRHGEAFRFRSEVMVKRQDFKLYAPKVVDPFVKDDITIVVDAVATPETVRAEEIPSLPED